MFKGPDGFKVEGLTCIKASFAEKGKCHFSFYFELPSYFYYIMVKVQHCKEWHTRLYKLERIFSQQVDLKSA